MLACGCTFGCGGGGTLRGNGEFAPDKFYHPQPAGTNESRHVLEDRPEPAMYNQVHVNVIGPQDPLLPEEEGPKTESVTEISPAAEALARRTATTAVASTAPTTGEVVPQGFAGAGGTAYTLGAVVVRVNNEPIFAHQVLQAITPVLATEAKQRDPESFRRFATSEIQTQIRDMIGSELVYGEAQQQLDQAEKEFAEQRTMMWRQQQIAKAGGSLEQARAAAAVDGKNFDDLVKDQHRFIMVGLYYQKKIYPRAEVTAADMRKFYDQNKDRLFGEPDTVQFRLICIDVKAAGRDDALKKINDLRARIKNGEDFATLASRFSDDTRLARTGGLEEPIQRGSYAQTAIEDAAWKLQVGEVSDVIDTGRSLYLVKVESRKAGHVQPFEDPAVQARIKDLLQKERMRPLVDAEQKRLIAQSAIEPDPPLIEPVVEMAMQNYPKWASASLPATQPQARK